MAQTIPIVDLQILDESISVKQIVKQLDDAFSTVGFVYLKNHHIKQESIKQVLETSAAFFQLPESTKNSFLRGTVSTNDGYVGKDQEIFDSNNLHEIREAYNITSPSSRCPDDSFQQAVHQLVPELCDLTRTLLKFMASALSLNEDFFCSRHQFMYQGVEKNATTFRSLYYPSLADSDVQPGVVRCGAHSDYGTITLLLQDDNGGLEVMSGGEWVSATPIPNTILVNLGDLMQFWTSDRYVATVHRVRVPEEELRRRTPRQSIAFFVHPDNDVMVSPLTSDGSSKHKPIGALEHLNARLSATYKY